MLAQRWLSLSTRSEVLAKQGRGEYVSIGRRKQDKRYLIERLSSNLVNADACGLTVLPANLIRMVPLVPSFITLPIALCLLLLLNT